MIVYAVTPSGQSHFEYLLSQLANQPVGYYLDFNSVIYCLDGMTHEKGLELINAISDEVEAMYAWLSDHVQEAESSGSFGARMIVKQYLMVAETLVSWISVVRSEFIDELRGGD